MTALFFCYIVIHRKLWYNIETVNNPAPRDGLA